jgi:hypothetical protein
MIFCAVGLLAASAAMAGVPSAGTSTQPAFVVLSAQSGGIPDTRGQITYTIRDASSNPVPGSVVIFNFAGCVHDVRIASEAQAGITVNCAAHTVTGVTNGSGQLTIAMVGMSNGGPPFAPNITGACLTVTADGVALSSLRVATADENGTGLGVDANDISVCFGDKQNFNTAARSDLDNNGIVDANDISQVFGYKKAAANTCGTACP